MNLIHHSRTTTTPKKKTERSRLCWNATKVIFFVCCVLLLLLSLSIQSTITAHGHMEVGVMVAPGSTIEERQQQQSSYSSTTTAISPREVNQDFLLPERDAEPERDKRGRPVYKFPTFPRFDLVPPERRRATRHPNEDAIQDQPLKRNLSIQWTKNHQPLSALSQRLYQHQRNCSLPLGNFQFRKKIFGMGSDIHVWSQTLCNAIEEGVRVRTRGDEREWVWYDQDQCGRDRDHDSTSLVNMESSVMTCYFPTSELQCAQDRSMNLSEISHDIANPIENRCASLMKKWNIPSVGHFRAAAMEFLFSQLSPIVVQEAEEQLNLVFPGGKVPPNLITVHIRWGDKRYESKLVPIDAYMDGIRSIIRDMGLEDDDGSTKGGVDIFLAAEDPLAIDAFLKAKPKEWRVHLDQFYYEMIPYRPVGDVPYNIVPRVSRDLRGKLGLVSLGSLLVAMEAKGFVLATISNWSRLMNELRKNVVNPQCGNCTYMIDLRYGEW